MSSLPSSFPPSSITNIKNISITNINIKIIKTNLLLD